MAVVEHHRMIHEGDLQVGWGETGELEFRAGRGRTLEHAPALRLAAGELDELERWFAEADERLDPSVHFPR